MRSIYLDHHATTPLDPAVFQAMIPFYQVHFGNPASLSHGYGTRANSAVQMSRETIAEILKVTPQEIFFTSSATESNNIAISGFLKTQDSGAHMIISSVEHSSVREVAKEWQKRGIEVTLIDVDQDGLIKLDEFKKSIRPETKLVSIQTANQEMGSIQNIAEISKICAEHEIVFHTDATQAFGKVRLDFSAHKIGMASLSAHKIYGPKGAAVLFVRRKDPRVMLEPLFFGGGQEETLRPGTLNVPAIVGLGVAAQIADQLIDEESFRMNRLRDQFWKKLSSGFPKALINGGTKFRLSNNLSIRLPGIEAKTLVSNIQKEVSLSLGSACVNERHPVSQVLMALGMTENEAKESFRVGIGRFNTPEELDIAAQRILDEIRLILGQNSVK